MTLDRDLEFVGADQKHADERCEVARQTVVHDETLAHLHCCFFQHSLIHTAMIHHHHAVIVTTSGQSNLTTDRIAATQVWFNGIRQVVLVCTLGMLNLFFLNIRSSFATIRILFEVRKWPRQPSSKMAAAAGRRRTMAAASPTSLDHPASGPRQTKWQSPMGVSPPPITTDARSKRPATDSKDHDHRRITTVSRYAGYFDVSAGQEVPRWVGWTGLYGRASPPRLLLISFTLEKLPS